MRIQTLLDSLNQLVEAEDESLNQLTSFLNHPDVADNTKTQIQKYVNAWATFPDDIKEIVSKHVSKDVENQLQTADKQRDKDAALSVWIDLDLMEKIAAELGEIPGVSRANLWTRVPGKEAIYIDLWYMNSRMERRPGTGGKLVFSRNGRLSGGLNYREYNSTWAVNQTNALFHIQNKTEANIRNVLKKFDPKFPISV